jgi:hypothetical protein
MGLSPFQFATAELWRMGTSKIVKYSYRVRTSIGYVYGMRQSYLFYWLICDGGYGKNVSVVEKSFKIF